jgi:hypothetical protein
VQTGSVIEPEDPDGNPIYLWEPAVEESPEIEVSVVTYA